MKYFKWLFVLVTLQMGVCYAQGFTSSNLPIVVITNTINMPADSAWYDIVVHMGIIDNGPGKRNRIGDPYNNYNGKVFFKVHGSSSVAFPKRSFRITTINKLHQHIDVPLLGMPAHEDWVMKSLYQDKSLLRDDLAFRLFRQMGNYSSRSVFFELVMNGEYRGVYQMLEKVKRSKDRVNISGLSPSDNSGDALTGGYIIRLDKYLPGDQGWHSKYKSKGDSANYYLYYYPSQDSITPMQKLYIKDYIEKMEDAIASTDFADPQKGYRKYIHVPSFIDNLIINELSKNIDGYRASTFFTKDKESSGDGKLKASPIWDYNIAFGNCYYNFANVPSGWQYREFFNEHFIPFWWKRLMEDPAFRNDLLCRYSKLRQNILNPDNIYSYIDLMAAHLNEAVKRNFERWPIMDSVIFPNPSPVPGSYAGEINYLKWWIDARLKWMDANITGDCVEPPVVEKPRIEPVDVAVYPNPFHSSSVITYHASGPSTPVSIRLFNMLGDHIKTVFEGNKKEGNYQETVGTEELASGPYILRYHISDSVYYKKIIKL